MIKNIRNKWKEILIIILGVSLIYTMAGGFINKPNLPDVVDKEIVYVGYENKEPLANFSKEGAVNALIDILKGIGETRNGKEQTIEERVENLSANSKIEEVFTDKTLNSLYYTEEFGSNEFNKSYTGGALLAYYQVITEEMGTEFEAFDEMYEDVVYLDNKFMTAQVPLDVILGTPTRIAFQMQYIDGEWKLNPYTATMSLHLMGMLEAGKEIKE